MANPANRGDCPSRVGKLFRMSRNKGKFPAFLDCPGLSFSWAERRFSFENALGKPPSGAVAVRARRCKS